ncbi:MAG: glycosyltransferase family 4 protein [Chlorobium sp.]|nr:glycosyltransferase family 4 protein [Chlorobium sp.]
MRIIYLHQYFNTPDMTGGTRSYELARRLVEAGHEVHLLTTDKAQQTGRSRWRISTEAGITVHWAPVPYNNTMSFIRRILAFIHFAVRSSIRAASLKGDVIFATSTPLTIAVPAILVSWWKNKPFVFEVRDMWPDVPIAIGAIRNPIIIWLANQLELLAYNFAAKVVALAPGMREDIIRKGISPEKVFVIPNGCDLDVFGKKPVGLSPRDEFPWLGTRKMVLFAGTLGLVNGVGYFVKLASQVAIHEPEVRFVVIGGGGEREMVRELALSEGVLNRSLFMFDQMPKRELVRWLHAADMVMALFTGPAAVWKNAVQNKFFDALAAGKPIVNNFDGWQSRIAVEAGVGLIIDPQDISLAAADLLKSLFDEVWLCGVRERTRQLAEGRFNRDFLAHQLESILLDVVQYQNPKS